MLLRGLGAPLGHLSAWRFLKICGLMLAIWLELHDREQFSVVPIVFVHLVVYLSPVVGYECMTKVVDFLQAAFLY